MWIAKIKKSLLSLSRAELATKPSFDAQSGSTHIASSELVLAALLIRQPDTPALRFFDLYNVLFIGVYLALKTVLLYS